MSHPPNPPSGMSFFDRDEPARPVAASGTPPVASPGTAPVAPPVASPGTPARQYRTGRARAVRALGMLGVLSVASAAVITVIGPGSASADPSQNDWYRLRMCESSNNYSINTGNDHYGAYQFDLGTWRSVGGTGYPNKASAAEQDARALILYRERGWQPWQCAAIVGLKDDKDAKSGRISDIKVPMSTVTSPPKVTPPKNTGGAPPMTGGTAYYTYGDYNVAISLWKIQMRKRGAAIASTGTLDAATLALVKRVQGLNGLPETGLLGPVTWGLAWTGKYSKPASKPVTAPKPKPVKKPVTKPIKKPVTKPVTKPVRTPVTVVRAVSKAPAMPGPAYFAAGDYSRTISLWKIQMRKRGAYIASTGTLDAATLQLVKRVQGLAGLPQTGLLGPVTWSLAWTGSYVGPRQVARAVAKAPAMPGVAYFTSGSYSRTISLWKLQMRKRGAIVNTSGTLDGSTLALVKQVQRLNHLPQTGLLGPVTWGLAWTGKY